MRLHVAIAVAYIVGCFVAATAAAADTNSTRAAGSLDWRNKGVIAPVTNQARDGSSSAFAAVGAVEALNAIATGRLTLGSGVDVTKCSKCGVTGEMDCVFKYIASYGGICPAEEAASCSCKPTMSVSSWTTVDSTEAALLAAVQKQPVAVAVNAASPAFEMYSGGVVAASDCASSSVDHMVLVVGYGTDDQGVDYWIAQNSWGASWGEHGYIRLARHGNTCGINTMPVFPVA